MACRLINLHKYPLSIDLRGGDTLVLAPGQTSHALLEELLYDNHHLPGWEAAGWVARLPAKFADTQPQTAAEDAEAKPAEEPADEAEDEAEDEADSESDEDADPDAPHPKPRRRKKQR
jgi:hypothetical protein